MKNRASTRQDRAVSPVIAVILMVAITVVLAATVYVWVSGLSKQQDKQENASVRTISDDSDNDGLDDYLSILLVRGDNAPYGSVDVQIGLAPLCTAIPSAGACDSGTEFGSDVQTWAVGEHLYVPCTGQETVQVTVTLNGTVIFDDVAQCDEAN